MRWKQVTLVGVGLLGGSLGMALRQRRLAERVIGLVRRESSVAECVRMGAVHAATLDGAQAVAEADLVVLGTPLGRMESLVKQVRGALRPGVLVTDVGSVKGPVVAALEPLIEAVGARFVGGHPMAGSEHAGVGHARADLFEGAVCVVTPGPKSDEASIAEVEDLWRSVGGAVRRMSPEGHDALVRWSSHLPHLVAAALVHRVLDPARGEDQRALCATGFRDSTRVASGSPEMWRDIALMNRERLAEGVGSLRDLLEDLRRKLLEGDAAALEGFFAEARARRDAWLAEFESGAGRGTSGE